MDDFTFFSTNAILKNESIFSKMVAIILAKKYSFIYDDEIGTSIIHQVTIISTE